MTVDQVVSPAMDLPANHPSPDLAHRAIRALETARSAPGADRIVIEERAVYRPESWLIQRSWEVLAEAGEAQPALEVARLASSRQPAAVIQCLYRLSRKIDQHWGLGAVVARELAGMQAALLRGTFSQESSRHAEQLLFGAATAANLDERSQAFIFLERLDQLPQPWDRIMVQPDQRSMLANTVLRIGPHPLTVALMTHALRRFGDAGAHFVLDVTTGASERLRRGQPSAKMTRFMNLGVAVFRNASLTSLHSRRLTATVLGQAGLVDEVLEQLTTIANVQAARRDSGLSLRAGDKDLLRQVKRPSANADIDFQVYTLREAIRGMAPRQLTREQRIQLADQLALLGSQSDGWTAAGAATTLVELGAVKYAQDVIGKIPAGDPTRSEGIISLVRALLVAGEPTLASEYVQKGLVWAHSYPGRNPERALVWGLAEVYLERNQPEEALALLDQRQAPAGLMRRVRGAFNRKMTDDELRDEGLRLQARLLEDHTPSSDIQRMVKQLQTWAPRLLDGEARVNFLVDDMLRPLLASGRTRLGLSMLPSLLAALATGSGEKHAMRVATIANVILYELAPVAPERLDPSTNGAAARPLLEPETRQALEDFVEGVWTQDAARGVWQTVHGVEGSLRLLLALEGPETVISIARAMASIPVEESV